ncbi:taste receptor type 2 member 41 [Ochotona curzoniae]|uniref:taste receptor type 2 member 41 n=1 Tax=Ochotona curzoniae TaxID=130825 RepID=UPI001B349ADF|nr:taste receptor type 2 member 41 [Ochotona curzoniae]
MQPALSFSFMLLFVLLSVLGILGNSFIVLVLSREWLRHGRLLPSDKILISLSASRCCLQCVGLGDNFYSYLYQEKYFRGVAHKFFHLYWHFLSVAAFWFGTWLSVLFCVKIANFSHPTFLWLKWRLPRLVAWFLLSFVLMAFITTLLLFWGNHILHQGLILKKYSGNITYKEWRRKIIFHFLLPVKLVSLSTPFSVFLLSILLLISSLRRHTCRMKLNGHSQQDSSSQAHSRALRSLLSFLTLYILSFMCLVIDDTFFFPLESEWYWPWQIILYLCIFFHPFILISSNLKLRNVIRHLLSLARGFWVAQVAVSPYTEEENRMMAHLRGNAFIGS